MELAEKTMLHPHHIAPGGTADLVILNARSVSQAIGASCPNRTTIKVGKVVSQVMHQVWSD